MLGKMKNNFMEAYVWMYGSTKKKANEVFRRAMEIADYDYIKEVIACYESNAQKSFYND